MTALEVASAKLAEEKKMIHQYRGLFYTNYDGNKYVGVIDLLGEYSEEPATLASHDVSRLTATDTHDIVSLH